MVSSENTFNNKNIVTHRHTKIFEASKISINNVNEFYSIIRISFNYEFAR